MRIGNNRHVKPDASAETELVAIAPRTQPLRAVVMPSIRTYDSYENVRRFSNREQELSIWSIWPFLAFAFAVLIWLLILFRDVLTVLYVVVVMVFDKLR